MMFHSDFLPHRFVYEHQRPNETSKEAEQAQSGAARRDLKELRERVEKSNLPKRAIPGVEYFPLAPPGAPPPSPKGAPPAPTAGPTIVEKLGKQPISLDRDTSDEELLIIKELKTIKAREFDNKIIGGKTNLENFQRYNQMIENLPYEMAYGAILANKSKGQLIKEFTDTMENLRNKVLKRALWKEAWGGVKGAWNWLAEDSEKTLGGMHAGIQKRINEGTQLIHPRLAPMLYADLQELNDALFTAPLEAADDDDIDEDQREFIEKMILPNLAQKIINSTIVMNFPVGEKKREPIDPKNPKKGMIDPLAPVSTPIYTPDYTLENEVIRTVDKKTPYEFAIRHIAQTYGAALINLRESCFKPEPKTERATEREKAKDSASINQAHGFTPREIPDALLVEEQQAVNDWVKRNLAKYNR